jgi:UDPglucose 6-dehydrogenase
MNKRRVVSILVILYTTITFAEPQSWSVSQPLRIAVIGTGYVGLVTGSCLASLGHQVTCIDSDSNKINALNQGTIIIFEPGLEQLFQRVTQLGLLTFSVSCSAAIKDAEIIMITVGTPTLPNGQSDLNSVYSVINEISHSLSSFKIICMKSTVPIGTITTITQVLRDKGIDEENFALVYNPEFLREGSATHDFFNPDRIIIGSDSSVAIKKMMQMYEPFLQRNIPFVYTDSLSAEVIKYASNAFLPIKISFINEIANLCDASSANISDVAQGIGLDKRIGSAFLNPGPGFGGSCFPKDCASLLHMGKMYGTPLHTVHAALMTNEEQKKKPVQKLKTLMGSDLKGKTITILGLAFKANTDDIRHSPAITTIELLLEEGAFIKAYDPAASTHMRALFPTLTYCGTAYEALQDADACIIMTEWPEFKTLDATTMRSLMKDRYLIDARNILDCTSLARAGFIFDAIGRHGIIKSLLTYQDEIAAVDTAERNT